MFQIGSIESKSGFYSNQATLDYVPRIQAKLDGLDRTKADLNKRIEDVLIGSKPDFYFTPENFTNEEFCVFVNFILIHLYRKCIFLIESRQDNYGRWEINSGSIQLGISENANIPSLYIMDKKNKVYIELNILKVKTDIVRFYKGSSFGFESELPPGDYLFDVSQKGFCTFVPADLWNESDTEDEAVQIIPVNMQLLSAIRITLDNADRIINNYIKTLQY